MYDVRFLYPHSSRRLVLARAERADGSSDVEAFFELPAPVIGDLDEHTVREMVLGVPSGAKH